MQERDSETKTLAFLVDERTICVLDLASGHERASIHHDQSFDWLELNESADKLLFRDRTQRLFLIRLHDPDFNPICLLTSCGFVQWVPFSDVFVGQQHDELHVFYDSQRAQVYSLPVGCQAIGIERGDGQSWVQLDDTNVERLPLNETLLELDAALQQSNLRR